MNDQQKRNLIADQFYDQVHAAIESDSIDLIPDSGPFAAAAARSIDVSHLPEPYRQSAAALLRGFAKNYGVDRPKGLDGCE